MKTYKQLRNEFRQAARQELKNGLVQCTESQQLKFAMMYAKDNLQLTVEEIVDRMDWERLDWAMQQVKRTLEKNEGV